METAKVNILPDVAELETQAQIRKTVMVLAWPAITEMFLATLVQFVDTAMVGSLGAVAIAAIGVSNSPMWLLMGMFAALGVGSTALVARFIGGKDIESANKVAQQSLLMGVALASIVTLLALLFAEVVPTWMGAEPDVIPVAASYLRIVSLTFVLTFSSFILTGVLRGAGDTKTPMRVNALANIINIIANFLLIFPTRDVLLNLPILGELAVTIHGAGLGIQGAAIGTALSRGIAGLIVLYILFAGRQGVRIHFSLKLDLDIIRRVIKVGLPASGERLIMSGGHMLFSIIVLGLGTAQYAAHHLAIVAESVSYMPGFGFSMAATTLVGQALGAGKPQLAESSGFITWKIGALVMCGMGVIFLVIPEYLIMLFNRDPDIIRYGAMCLRLVALAQLPFSASMILTGALRGAGDTVWPLIIAGIGMWPIRLGIAWMLVTQLNMGLLGAWIAMVVDLYVRGIITFIRFKSGRWKTIKI
jgi:putative MATE family efflux protein